MQPSSGARCLDLSGLFVYLHNSCVWSAMALARQRGCAGSHEPSLVAYVISTIISWDNSNILFTCTALMEQTYHGHQSLSFIAKISTVTVTRDPSAMTERYLKCNKIVIFICSVANCRNRKMLFYDLFIYLFPPLNILTRNTNSLWNLCWSWNSSISPTLNCVLVSIHVFIKMTEVWA